ncbi:MAG: hypothetical protein KUG63_03110 [Cycloclasticus sp.]|jgi:hypothetical protein|uniref:hypothetical protein n=1 Tax=Cycloclasticus sp. TaxID=2024830 RepID=UPI00257DF469|nr:hypothetical protein [Cycloclasticus sp.]MBV1898345.1 hypothetical protein [Cycloclasticus sp.]
MTSTTDALKEVLDNVPISDLEKLKKQQSYYQRLIKNGTARKQVYNLKPVSAI